MYQRIAMEIARHPSLKLTAGTEQKRNAPIQDLIGDKEKHRRQKDHDKYHHGGNRRLTPRRPGHFCNFASNLLNELERCCFCHAANLKAREIIESRAFEPPTYAKNPQDARALRLISSWQGRRDSNPRPPVLETGALPAELHPLISGAYLAINCRKRKTF